MEQGRETAGAASSICFLLIQTASALHPVYWEGIHSTCAVSEMFTITLDFKYKTPSLAFSITEPEKHAAATQEYNTYRKKD